MVFVYQVALSNPNWGAVFSGLVPTTKAFETSPTIGGMTPLSGSLGIIGATVMPHNLYLHSAVSQTREIDHNDEEDVARTLRFSTWDSNIQLSFAFIVNSLLLVMGVAVFKSGAVQDPSFFGLFHALNDTSTLSNGILIGVAKTGVLSTLFAIALLASGQNSTITGTLTGQVIMEGFIHMRMPLWARRLITRLISVVPVLICVMITSGKGDLQEHEALNQLMNNSQVFLAFALPFSMIPLLMMTDSRVEMGDRFKNSWAVKILGWISVIFLTYLNITGLPNSITAFFGANPSAGEVELAHIIAYMLVAVVLALLAWTVFELHKGNQRYELEMQSKAEAKEEA